MEKVETKNEIEKYVGAKVAKTAPTVSIITPAYNIAEYVAETLDSVFAQTFLDYEIIVVNDGSPDTVDFERVLEPYREKIVHLKQPNGGAGAARNAAIEHARGQFLAFLDGDDIWNADFLESQINFLEKNQLEMVYSNAILFGEPLFAGRTYMQNAPSDGECTAAALIGGACNVITSGTVVRKRILDKFGMFDVTLQRIEDFDLWFRLAKNNVKIGYQREVLLKYRVRPNSLSGSNIQRAERTLHAYETIERKYELTAAEEKILEKRRLGAVAELHLETGKTRLAHGDFRDARTHFAEANKFYRQPKLSAINWLIRFSPRLARRLFKALRPLEFSYAAPNES